MHEHNVICRDVTVKLKLVKLKLVFSPFLAFPVMWEEVIEESWSENIEKFLD